MRVLLPAAMAAALLVLAGCGGGDDEPAPTQAAQGLWTGMTGSNRTVTGLVFGDGSYYVMYSSPGYPTVLGGAVMGRGSTMSGASFSSANALHLNLEGLGVLRASVAATVVEKQSFDGSILSTGIPAVTFNSTYDSDFERPADASALSGDYAGLLGTSKGKLTAAWTIRDTGLFTVAASNGCTAQGSALLRSGINVYNVALTFGPAPCPLPGQTVNGVAYLRATDKRLFVAAPNGDGSDAALLSGTKP